MDDYFQSWVYTPDRSSQSFWSVWLEENPHKRSDIEEARRGLLRLNFSTYELPAAEVAEIWKNIRRGTPALSKKKKSALRGRLWYAAASLLLLIGVGYLLLYKQPSELLYTTGFGETKTIVLPDSSTVVLNSNSSLRLKTAWANNEPREVWLDGEAFFSVIHKESDQLFKVKTEDNVEIEVLGTTFNVYNREETKVVLNTGRIQLSLPTIENDEKIVMQPGDLVEYTEKKFVKRNVDPKVYSAWTENTLMLNRTSLGEMLRMMKDNYGIEVEVSKEMLDETISGSMPMTDAESLLTQIAKAFQLKVVRKEDKIYLEEI